MTPDLVVFDCDGVLVDTEGPIFEVLCDSFTRYGLPMTPHEAAKTLTGSTIEQLRDFGSAKGAALPTTWVNDIYEGIDARLSDGVEMFDGAMDLVDALEALKVPVFVASNGTMSRMSHSLGPSGLWQRLSGRILSCETFAPKPDPAMILHAVQQTGADPSRSFFVDDSTAGCRAGIAAGVHTIGFATEGQDEQLAALGTTVANSMAQAQRIILG